MEEKNSNKKKEMTLDELARIVQEGFLDIKSDVKILKTDAHGLKIDVEVLKTDVGILKTDVADIKSTVDNIEANLNKKVDKIDHNTLTYRVEKLEKKFA
jgi:hypothetical protein